MRMTPGAPGETPKPNAKVLKNQASIIKRSAAALGAWRLELGVWCFHRRLRSKWVSPSFRHGGISGQKQWTEHQVNPANHQVQPAQNCQLQEIRQIQAIAENSECQEQRPRHQRCAGKPPALPQIQIPVFKKCYQPGRQAINRAQVIIKPTMTAAAAIASNPGSQAPHNGSSSVRLKAIRQPSG